MILSITGIKVSLDEGEDALSAKAAEILSIPRESVSSLKILRRSLDARRNRPPFFVYVVEVVLPGNVNLPDTAGGDVSVRVVGGEKAFEISDAVVAGKKDSLSCRPVSKAEKGQKVIIAGCGPAGLFAALTLAEKGKPVLLLERGQNIPERCGDVHNFWERGELKRESNVHFGEGGAGAFSDGKLTSRANNPRTGNIKRTLVELGAPPDIMIDAKPHIGTDRLRGVVVNFREKLLALGCEIRFGAKVSDLLIRGNRVCGVVVNADEEIMADHLILAMGQHADDTYEMLHKKGVSMAPKPFSMGLRVEHPQQLINELQYGKWQGHPALPKADYFLTAKVTSPLRSVYTFCMCPGGRIIGCSSEQGALVTNGMSGSLRDGVYANSAVVVNINAEDFSGTVEEPLRGLLFRKNWEEKAFLLGGADYFAPAQRLSDFLSDGEGGGLLPVSFLPGVRAATLRDTLPPFVTAALKEGFRQFEAKMRGFVSEEAMLIGVETRTSSPVRILRKEDGESANTEGLYPCGEGAGYAGGIISSALDGIRAAENVINSPDERQ